MYEFRKECLHVQKKLMHLLCCFFVYYPEYSLNLTVFLMYFSFGFSRENGRSQSPAKLGSTPEIGGRESPRDRNGIVQNGRTKQPLQQQQVQPQQQDDVRNGGRYNSAKVTSSQNNNTRLTRVSPDSQSDRIAATDSGPPPVEHEEIDSNSEFPDYLT